MVSPGAWKALAAVFRICQLAAFGVRFAAGANGQIIVQPIIEPSPLIAKGRLEGGINGEGDPRPDG